MESIDNQCLQKLKDITNICKINLKKKKSIKLTIYPKDVIINAYKSSEKWKTKKRFKSQILNLKTKKA